MSFLAIKDHFKFSFFCCVCYFCIQKKNLFSRLIIPYELCFLSLLLLKFLFPSPGWRRERGNFWLEEILLYPNLKVSWFWAEGGGASGHWLGKKSTRVPWDDNQVNSYGTAHEELRKTRAMTAQDNVQGRMARSAQTWLAWKKQDCLNTLGARRNRCILAATPQGVAESRSIPSAV